MYTPCVQHRLLGLVSILPSLLGDIGALIGVGVIAYLIFFYHSDDETQYEPEDRRALVLFSALASVLILVPFGACTVLLMWLTAKASQLYLKLASVQSPDGVAVGLTSLPNAVVQAGGCERHENDVAYP
jgi:hypothetical protein